MKKNKTFLGSFENFVNEAEKVETKKTPSKEVEKTKKEEKVETEKPKPTGEKVTELIQKFLKSKGLLEDHVIAQGDKKKIEFILSRAQDKASIKFKMNRQGKITGYEFEKFSPDGMIIDNMISYFEVLTVLYEDLNGQGKFAKSIETALQQ
jgi:hypothetical protein